MSARRRRLADGVGTQAAPGPPRRGSGLRITGGRLRGRRLAVPSEGVRPTADRVRESMFARLTQLEGARVLDLYAGSGALGMEALSRGAESVVFVDASTASIRALEENIHALDLRAETRVMRGDCVKVLEALGEAELRFDLVTIDPPYDSAQLSLALSLLVEARLLSPASTVVVETAKRHAVPAAEGLALLDEREYGDTRITRLVVASPESPA